MSNIQHIGQLTGEFVDENSGEPSFVVNMDDPTTPAFIERIKASIVTLSSADSQNEVGAPKAAPAATVAKGK